MSLCDWLAKSCCCCSRPCTSSSPTTPTSPPVDHQQQRNDGGGRCSQRQQEGQVVAHMQQQNNATVVEVVSSHFQPKRSITNACSGDGEIGEIHISCHPTTFDATSGESHNSILPHLQSALGERNGRKISPLRHDHRQHAVVKERVGDTAVITFSTRVLAPDMIKVPLTVCTSNGSSESAANASSCGPYRTCPNFISVQSIQESFQKFADFCSKTAFGSGNAADLGEKAGGNSRTLLVPYHGGVHKFSLEQRSNLVESEAVLAKRATKSLPATARPPLEYFQVGEQHLLGKLIPRLSIPLEDVEGDDECDASSRVAVTITTTSSSDTLISTEKEIHTELTDETEARASGAATPSAISESPSPPKSFFEMLDIASHHPDLINFQIVLNDWIRKQAKIVGCAFIMTSLEFNVSYCQVCANRTLGEPLICGSWDLMENVFDNQSFVKASKRRLPDETFGYATRKNDPETALVFSVEEDLLQPVSTGLRAVVSRIFETIPTEGKHWTFDGASNGTTSPSSLVEIRSQSGFQAGLLVVHQSTRTVSDELSCILPHIRMISTLISIVENVEEQKRLAQQSEQMLSMTQSVFSSLPL